MRLQTGIAFAHRQDHRHREQGPHTSSDAPKLAPQGTLAGHRWEIQGVAYFPGGKLIASADDGGFVAVWDAVTRKQKLAKAGRHTPALHRSVAGRQDHASGGNDSIRFWDAATGRETSPHREPADQRARLQPRRQVTGR
jgi:WD40 repeat protein